MSAKIDLITTKLKDMISHVLKTDAGFIDEDESFLEMGADSSLLYDFKAMIKKTFGVDIQVTDFFQNLTSVSTTAQYILQVQPDCVCSDDEDPAAKERINAKAVGNSGDLESRLAQILELLRGSEDVPKAVPAQNRALVQNGEEKNDTSAQRPYVAFKHISSERIYKEQRIKDAIKQLQDDYNEQTASSKKYVEKYRKPYADCRNVAGFRMDLKEMVYQLVAKNSSGSNITDIDGINYIDIAMGFGVNLFGHKPDFIMKALRSELETGFPLSMISRLSGEVAKKICALTGHDRVAFFNSGTEAVMVAVRIARAKTQRRCVVLFSGSYHGTYDGILGIKGDNGHRPEPISPGVLPSIIDDLIILDYGDMNALNFIEEQAENIAAVLIEPVQSRNPGLQPWEFVRALRKLTKEMGIAFIIDEMITGFRICAGGVQEHIGVGADLATYGKIVGGGMPIGVVAGKSEFMDCIDGGVWSFGDDSFPPHEAQRTFVAGTFCHHPLTMAAANATLDQIIAQKEILYPAINSRTKRLADELNVFFALKRIPMSVVYFGSLFRFITKGNLEIFYYYMLREGIYIWEGRNCFLSAAHTDEDVDRIIVAVKRTALKMQSVFFETPAPINERIAISYDDRIMLAHMQIAGDDSSMHESVLLKTEKSIEPLALTLSIIRTLSRYPVLTAKIANDGSALVCCDAESCNYEPVFLTCNDSELDLLVRKLRGQRFDCYNECMFRVYVIDCADKRYLFIIMHHLIADGWSIGNFVDEICQQYTSIVHSAPEPRFKPVIGIEQYRTEKNKKLDQIDFDKAREFILDTTAVCPHSIALPCMKKSTGNTGKRLHQNVGRELLSRIGAVARKIGCTSYFIMLAAAQILTSKITEQDVFAIGVPFAGQLLIDNKSIFGNLAKVVPIVSNCFGGCSVTSLVKRNMSLFESYSEYNWAYEELFDTVEHAQLPNINVVFNMDQFNEMSIDGEPLEYISTDIESVVYDLFINATVNADNLYIELDYNCDMFEDVQAKDWISAYIHILRQITDGDIRIGEIECAAQFRSELSLAKTPELNEAGFFAVVDRYGNLVPHGTIGRIMELDCFGIPIETGERGFTAADGCIYRIDEISEDNAKKQHDYSEMSAIERYICTICEETTGVTCIDLDDDLIALGMSSVRVISLIAAIEQKYGVSITVVDVANAMTVRGIAKMIVSGSRSKALSEPIVPLNRMDAYECSFAQKRLYIACKLNKCSTTYNLPDVTVVDGRFDEERFCTAIRHIMERHEILRTVFYEENGHIKQAVIDEPVVEFEAKNVSVGSITEEELIKREMEDFVKPFDLDKLPLMRYRLLRITDDHSVLLFDAHHIIFDGHSKLRFVTELFEELRGNFDIKADEVQYKDYAAWQNERQSKFIDKQEEFWKNLYPDGVAQLNLIADKPTTMVGSGSRKGITQRICIDGLQAIRIRQFAAQLMTTPAVVFLSAYAYLLKMCTNDESIVVGVTVDGRTNWQTQNMIGFFVNNLPMPIDVSDHRSVWSMITDVRDTLVSVVDNVDIPLNRLIEICVKERSSSRNPLFSVGFVYQDFYETGVYTVGDTQYRTCKYASDNIMSDVECEIFNMDNSFDIELKFADDMFYEATSKSLAGLFERIITAITSSSELALGSIPLISDDERKELETRFNNTSVALIHASVLDMFKERVSACPDKPAIEFEGNTLTYAQLDNWSSCIANRLANKGIGHGDNVAVISGAAPELIASILGTIKAGAAYIPIQNGMPSERVSYILKDSGAKIILSNADTSQYPVEAFNPCECRNSTAEPILFDVKPDEAAYIIYTSGTTGNPKGVVVEHGALCTYISNCQRRYAGFDGVMPLFTNITFDLTVTSIFLPLTSGGKMVIYSGDVADSIEKIFNNDELTIIKMTPGHLKMANMLESIGEMSKLKSVILGGEALMCADCDRFLEKFGNSVDIHNEYGPTEATVGCCDHVYDKESDIKSSVSIGCPSDNMHIYIIRNDRQCGVGVSGELCIGGSSLARGYINNHELTDKVFKRNSEVGERIYHSGDLARITSDYTLEYLGRIDDQIKLNGFRIEPDEIETAIAGLPDVSAAAVIVRKTIGGKSLCAFFTAVGEIDSDAIRCQLTDKLPGYMIPNAFCQLPELPLTSNGKVDRKKLENIEVTVNNSIKEPSTEQERVLALAIKSVFNVESVNMHDSYYSVYGDSINAISVISFVREYGYSIDLEDFDSTLERIAIKMQKSDDLEKYEQGVVVGSSPLSPIQEWFYSLKLADPNHFDQSLLIELGESYGTDMHKTVWQSLVNHHDVLRAKFDGSAMYINDVQTSGYIMRFVDAANTKDDEIKEICRKSLSDINIAAGVVLSVTVITRDGNDMVFIACHHLVVDGVSWQILINDMERLYKGNRELPMKTASYIQWSNALAELDDIPAADKQLEYWQAVENRLADAVFANSNGCGERIKTTVLIDTERTDTLLGAVCKHYNTSAEELLVSVGAAALGRVYGCGQFSFLMESIGRDKSLTKLDVSRTVGWFTVLYPVVVKVYDDLNNTVIETKENLRKVPRNAECYSLFKQKGSLAVSRIVPKITFNYMGNVKTDRIGNIKISDLFADEDVSKNNRTGQIMSINCTIIDGSLNIRIECDDSVIDSSRMACLVKAVDTVIADLIDESENNSDSIVTTSDIGAEDMSEDDIAELNKLISTL